MFADPLENQAWSILAGYDLAIRSRTALGSAGGFSGARIWRIESPTGNWCLKLWPPSGMDLERLSAIHDRMSAARSAGLDFVPRVLPRRDGMTCNQSDGRAWDLVEWMPGKADFEERPTPERMIAALTGLSRLHAVWRVGAPRQGPCPAIQRRLDRLDAWESAIHAGWQPRFAPAVADPLARVAQRAWQKLPPHLDVIRTLLAPIRDAPYPLHTCLGDVWHDHVLFEGDQLTGLIDYGAVRTDTPAVDLARLLGSLSPRDSALFDIGLQAYQVRSPLSREELQLVHILDYSGTVIGAANWLLWVYRDDRPLDDRAAAAERLAILVGRLENMQRTILPLKGKN